MKNLYKYLYLFIALCTVCSFIGCDDDNDYKKGDEPVIIGISPTSGEAGTLVTISGNNFGTSGTVYFNGIQASDIPLFSDTEIQVYAPESTTGTISVKVGTQTAVSDNSFTYPGNENQGGDDNGDGGDDNGGDEYPSGTFNHFFMSDDVVYKTGNSNPYDNAENDFSLWDSSPGDITIFKVEIPSPGYYYIDLNTATRVDGSYVNITIDSDLDTFIEETGLNGMYTHDIVFNDSWSDFSNKLEFGHYLLEEAGTYYVKITLMNDNGGSDTACLRYIEIYN